MLKHIPLLTLALVLLFALNAQAFEVTDKDVGGDSPFKVVVKQPADAKLIGFFRCDDSEEHPFAYALFERDGNYLMFVKIAKKYWGYTGAEVDGNVIYFGKGGHGKITLSDDGIHRTFKGKFKTALYKVK